jgi:hypothetical protein
MSEIYFSSREWKICSSEYRAADENFSVLMGKLAVSIGKAGSIGAFGDVKYFKTYSNPQSGRASPGFLSQAYNKAGFSMPENIHNFCRQQAGQAEQARQAEQAFQQAEQAWRAEQARQAKQAKQAEQAEQAEQAKQAKQAEQARQADHGRLHPKKNFDDLTNNTKRSLTRTNKDKDYVREMKLEGKLDPQSIDIYSTLSREGIALTQSQVNDIVLGIKYHSGNKTILQSRSGKAAGSEDILNKIRKLVKNNKNSEGSFDANLDFDPDAAMPSVEDEMSMDDCQPVEANTFSLSRFGSLTPTPNAFDYGPRDSIAGTPGPFMDGFSRASSIMPSFNSYGSDNREDTTFSGFSEFMVGTPRAFATPAPQTPSDYNDDRMSMTPMPQAQSAISSRYSSVGPGAPAPSGTARTAFSVGTPSVAGTPGPFDFQYDDNPMNYDLMNIDMSTPAPISEEWEQPTPDPRELDPYQYKDEAGRWLKTPQEQGWKWNRLEEE